MAQKAAIKKNCRSLWRRILKLSRAKFFHVFRQKIKSCNFLSLTNPAETAYLSVRDRELTKAVWLVEFQRRKVVVHTILGWSQAEMLRWPSCENYRKP